MQERGVGGEQNWRRVSMRLEINEAKCSLVLSESGWTSAWHVLGCANWLLYTCDIVNIVCASAS